MLVTVKQNHLIKLIMLWRKKKRYYINTSHVGMKLLIVTTLTLTPGHADYVKNMVTGAAQMDGAILL
jgi:translation elongation factor EF-Tu-like GTPase